MDDIVKIADCSRVTLAKNVVVATNYAVCENGLGMVVKVSDAIVNFFLV